MAMATEGEREREGETDRERERNEDNDTARRIMDGSPSMTSCSDADGSSFKFPSDCVQSRSRLDTLCHTKALFVPVPSSP